MRLGVVLPVRDEATRLPGLFATLGPFRGAGDPIVVVDDGSSDATAETAASLGAEVVRQPPLGRGVAIARGVAFLSKRVPVLLIAHADMRFPSGAREAIATALTEAPGIVGGALGHRIDDPRAIYRFVEWGNRFRARRLRLPYGDQAQFFRTEFLARIGGFPCQPRLEDLELSLRLRRVGPLLYVDRPVTIDARHWREGVLRTTLRNWATAVRYAVLAKST